jgi:Uma2 family endonuclease
MSSLLDRPTTAWTATDLARRFGPMPLWRFCFDPPPGEAVEEDVDRLETHHQLLYELVDGVLVRKTMSSYESLLAMRVATLLNLFILPRALGWVLGPDGMLRLWPGRVRIPDVSFISREQTPDGRFPQDQRIADLHPDLAVEILSDANTDEEMSEKRSDYFQSGTRLVWVIDPKTRSAEIFTSPDLKQTIEPDGVLTGEPVLPGLTIPLAKVFDIDAAL